jgi:hypothetical protein
MLGVFGPMGAVAGAAIAILGPLALAFINSSEGAKTLTDNMTELADAINLLNGAQSNAMTSASGLVEKYGNLSDSAKELFEIERDIAKLRAENALKNATTGIAGSFGAAPALGIDPDQIRLGAKAIDALSDVIVDLQEKQADTSSIVESLALDDVIGRLEVKASALVEISKNTKELSDALGITSEEAREVAARFAEISANDDANSRAKSMVSLAAYISDVSENLDGTNLKAKEMVDNLIAAATAALEVAAASDAIDFDGPASSASKLADELERAATNKRILSGRSGVGRKDEVVFDPRDPRYDPIAAAMASMEYGDGSTASKSTGGRKKGGGGGGAPDRIGALAKSLMSESEVVANWREESLAALADFNALELEALGGHAEARLRIEEEYNSKVKGLQESTKSNVLSGMNALGSILSSFASMQDGENKKSFEKQKKLQKASALVNGLSAGIAAWDKGMQAGGLPLATLYAAASAAQTAGQIAAINRTTYGGGGGAAPTAPAAAPAPSNYYIDLQGDTFSRASVQSTLSAALQGEIDRGARVVFGGA